jgi:hypothetical protein
LAWLNTIQNAYHYKTAPKRPSPLDIPIEPCIMRLITLLALVSTTVVAFAPSAKISRAVTNPSTTQLQIARRDIIVGAAAGWFFLAAPLLANAASSSTFFKPEDLQEPAQMSNQGGKLDLNAAFVVSMCGHGVKYLQA